MPLRIEFGVVRDLKRSGFRMLQAEEDLMRERSVDRPLWRCWIGFAIAGCMLSSGRAVAQPAVSGPLSLNEVVQLALKNYPALKESRARARAAVDGICVSRPGILAALRMRW